MKDMTQGKILPQLLSFSIFIFIGGMMQNLYLIIDSIILGRYVGEAALASVGIATPINFVVIGFLLGITQGFSINMAKSFGENNLAKLRKNLYNGMILCIIIGISATIILSFTNGYILKAMNTPENLYDATHNFLFVLYLGCTSSLFYNLFAGTLRAIGNSFAPLIFLAISVISNVSLVYIFVALLGYGVVATGFATIISQIISAVSCYLFIKKKYPELNIKQEEKIVDKKYINRLLRQGIPMGLQFSITGIGVIVMQTFLNGFSTNHIAGFNVAIRIQNILIYIFVALGSAIATFISQNYGAKKFDRITEAVKLSTIISLLLSVLCAILITTFGEQMTSLFIKENNVELVNAVTTYFNTVYIAYPLLAILILYRNALQGYGFPIFAMSAGVVELIMRVVVVILFTGTYGFVAICYADFATWVVTGIFLILSYIYLIKIKKVRA